MANDFTARFRVDISDLKKNITEANRQIKLANATFKAETAGMTDWTKDADGLSKKLEQLKSVLSNQKVILASYREQLERQQKAYEENGARADQLKAKLKELADSGVAKTDEEYQKFEKALKNCLKEQQNNSAAVEDLRLKVLNQQAAIGKTESSINKYTEAEANLGKEAESAAQDVADLGKATKEAGREAESSGEGFTVFKGVLANLATEAIGAAISGLKKLGQSIIDTAKDAINSYSEYEQLAGGVETLFKDSASIVEGYANDAYKTAGLSANKYMETITGFSASLLQGLGGDTKKAAEIGNKAVIDMADNSNKMGTSIESIQNAYQGFAKQNFTMLDNLKLGYGGTAAEMARLINDSGVMGETFKATAQNVKEISFDKYVEAIHKVQESMGITGTTAKEASETIQGSVSSMKSAWQNLLTEVVKDNGDIDGSINRFTESVQTAGKNILPRVKKFAESMVKILKENIKGIAQMVLDEIPELAKSGTDIVANLADAIVSALPDLSKAAISMIDTLVKKLISNAPKLSKAANELLRVLIKSIPGLITSIGKALIKGIPELSKIALELFGTLLTGLGEAAVELIAEIPNILGSIVTAIGDTFMGLFRGIEEGFTGTETIATRFKRLSEQQAQIHETRMKELQEEQSAVMESRKSWDEMLKSQEEAVSGSLGEVAYYEKLIGELQALVDKNGDVKKGYEDRADFIMGRLSEAFGVEINRISDVIGANGKLTESISDAIREKRKQILLQAKEEAYTEAIKRQPELIKQQAKAQEEYNAAIKESQDNFALADRLYRQAEQARKDGNDTLALAKEAEASLATQIANDAEIEARTVKATQNEIQEQLSDTIFAINDYETSYNKSVDEITTLTRQEAEAFAKSGDAKRAELAAKVKEEQAYIDWLKKKYEETGNVMYKTQLDQQEAQLKLTKNSLQERINAAKNASNGFLKAGEENTKAYADGTSDQTSVNRVREASRIIAENGFDTLMDARGKYTEAGRNTIQGLIDGLSDVAKNNEVTSLMGGLAANMVAALQTELQIHSPSRITERLGKFFVEGIPVGIRKNAQTALNEVSRFGHMLATGAQEMLGGISAGGSAVYTSKSAVNFTQNNYSPKPLSRIEILRQTQNILALAETVKEGN